MGSGDMTCYQGIEAQKRSHNKLGKVAIGHRYFLAFAETHCSIMSLPSTTIILWHVCQSIAHCLKLEVLYYSDRCKNFQF
jgi:hypothetical protein